MASFHDSRRSAVTAHHPEASPDASAAPPHSIRVAIAMATELDRMAWSLLVRNQQDMRLVAVASSSREFLALLKTHGADVVLIDEIILDRCPRSTVQAYARKASACRLILIAMHQPDYAEQPSHATLIHTHLLKGVSATALLQAIRTAATQPVSTAGDE